MKERAVRMAGEIRGNYANECAAIKAVAARLGIGSPETVRKAPAAICRKVAEAANGDLIKIWVERQVRASTEAAPDEASGTGR